MSLSLSMPTEKLHREVEKLKREVAVFILTFRGAEAQREKQNTSPPCAEDALLAFLGKVSSAPACWPAYSSQALVILGP